MCSIQRARYGFTLIETLVVVGTFVVLITLTLVSSTGLRSETAIESDVQELLGILRLAHSRTVASQDASSWGVHMATNSYTLFRGVSFNPSDPTNETHTLSAQVELSSWTLGGGGNDIVFDRVTGNTAMSGSVTLRLATVSHTRTVIVDPSGEVSVAGAPTQSPTGTRVTDTRHVHFTLGWSIQSATTLRLFFTGSGYSGPDVIQDIPIQNFISQGKFNWQGTVNVGGVDQQLKIHSHSMTPSDTILSVHRDVRYNTRPVDILIDGKLIASYNASHQVTVGPFGGVMQIQ